ncbi:unnamed protein product [Caenorhabditis auriculariae]|uniref:Brain protein I3 n=1 Tax=Caenorhabditis auriculariae TaxID=2777116 RepID=A0A8S1HGK3_9PELO|nr:unnamed protein product [Caenorhabditis auriculariae]
MPTQQNICPSCGKPQLKRRFDWRAILYAILCFPCGIYCCLRRRSRYCRGCHCDVIQSGERPIGQGLGYQYRHYQTTHKGLAPQEISAYRNHALSTSSTNGTLERDRTQSVSSDKHLIDTI